MNINVAFLVSQFYSEDFKRGLINKEEDKLKAQQIKFSKSGIFNVVYPLTGGTENDFKKLTCSQPLFILSNDSYNSFAAAAEIYSYMKEFTDKVVLLNPKETEIFWKIIRFIQKEKKIGLVGRPSDWLISSAFIDSQLAEKLNLKFVEFDLEEVIDNMKKAPEMIDKKIDAKVDKKITEDDIKAVTRLLNVFNELVEEDQLDALTIKCFEFLKYDITPCFTVAYSDNLIICEGDLQAVFSSLVLKELLGVRSFVANIVDQDEEKVRFAHCTVPVEITEDVTLTTHFESNKPLGIKATLPDDVYTVFRVVGKKLNTIVLASGLKVEDKYRNDVCRTQLTLNLPNFEVKANHHLIVRGEHKLELETFKKVWELLEK